MAGEDPVAAGADDAGRPGMCRKSENVLCFIAQLSQIGGKVMKIVVAKEKGGYELEIIIEVPMEMKITRELHKLQRYILDNIEQFSGLDLQGVNVTVGKIRKRNRKTDKVPEEQMKIPFS